MDPILSRLPTGPPCCPTASIAPHCSAALDGAQGAAPLGWSVFCSKIPVERDHNKTVTGIGPARVRPLPAVSGLTLDVKHINTVAGRQEKAD